MFRVIGFFRTIGGFAFAVLYLVLGIPVLIVEYFIGRKNPLKRDMSSLHMVQWGMSCIDRLCKVTTTVIGHENIPKDRPVLYVANHNSYFDILLTYPLCEDRTGYIAKSSLGKVPLLNIWMRRLYCLFIDREDMRQSMQVIQQAIDYVQNGISITIFPEGTRGDSEEMIPFKTGSLRIAEKSGCPIIPVAISNTRHIIGDYSPCAVPTHVIIQYGNPIYTDNLSKEDRKALGAITQSAIQKMLDEAKTMPVT